MNAVNHSRNRRPLARAASAAALLTAGLLALPLAVPAAAAAPASDNQPPSRPEASDLTMQPGGECRADPDAPYVDDTPRLRAVLRDPDSSQTDTVKVKGQFEVVWRERGEPSERISYTTAEKGSGSTFEYQLPSEPPTGTLIRWRVRASDGEAWGPWSTGGGQSWCQFRYDDVAPDDPVVSSGDYPDDGAWHDGVGVYGTFAFDSPSDDVVTYRYGVNNTPSPANELDPERPGGPVTLEWKPTDSGPQRVTVRAVDRAGNVSGTVTHHFNVSSGRDPVARWKLDESAGASGAADSAGDHPATAGSGVSFGGQGPLGEDDGAVALDGSEQGYLATDKAVVNTASSYSVAAWVRLDSGAAGATVLSHSGQEQSAFRLGYSAENDRWMFSHAPDDYPDWCPDWLDICPQSESVQSAQVPQADVWTHLVGIYDAVTEQLVLYVNGERVGATGDVDAWDATGTLQIGRALIDGDYTNAWPGDVADVRVFDRIVVPDEIAELSDRPAIRVGHWKLESATGGTTPDSDGAHDLILHGDAHIFESSTPLEPALVGNGHATLDGDGDYLASDGPVATTDRSFTVAATVRPGQLPDRSMAVLSQAGSSRSGFVLRYSGSEGLWQVEMPRQDSTGAEATTLTHAGVLPATGIGGQHLAVVYAAQHSELRLYVDGTLAGTTTAHTSTWNAQGDFQVGRALTGGTWSEYFAGAIDDVRVYEGVLETTKIQQLSLAS